MTKPIITLIAFIISVTLFAQNDSINFTDSNGLRQGIWEENVSNNLIARGEYIDNKKEGNWITHFTSGMVHEVVYYKEGKKNGIFIEVDNRGYFIAEDYFKDDKLDGKSIVYSRGGVKKSVTHYKEGEYNGVVIKYYDNMPGKILEESNYIMGVRNGMAKWYDQEGHLVAEYNYDNGNLDGMQKTFYPNGQVMTQEIYKDNVANGMYEEYHQNGHLKLTGNYVNANKDGKWYEYDEEGNEIKVIRYKDGEEK